MRAVLAAADHAHSGDGVGGAGGARRDEGGRGEDERRRRRTPTCYLVAQQRWFARASHDGVPVRSYGGGGHVERWVGPAEALGREGHCAPSPCSPGTG